jgi:hypothetical protein
MYLLIEKTGDRWLEKYDTRQPLVRPDRGFRIEYIIYFSPDATQLPKRGARHRVATA